MLLEGLSAMQIRPCERCPHFYAVSSMEFGTRRFVSITRTVVCTCHIPDHDGHIPTCTYIMRRVVYSDR